MSRLRVPTIATITGEGGSGGALALAVADRVLMLENAIYSVISPEGCASIMWKDASKKQQAAAALKYTAGDVKLLGCVDEVLPEPNGGTQNDPVGAMALVNERLQYHLANLRTLSVEDLLEQRYNKFRNIGAVLHYRLAVFRANSGAGTVAGAFNTTYSGRSERTLQLALFVTSVAWFLASDVLAGHAARRALGTIWSRRWAATARCAVSSFSACGWVFDPSGDCTSALPFA